MSAGPESTAAGPPEAADPGAWGRRGRRSAYHFGLVLVVLLCSVIFQLAAPDLSWDHWVTLLLQGGALILALRAARVSPRLRRGAEIAVVVLLLAAVPAFGFADSDPVGPRVMTLGLVVLAPIAIIRGLIREVREDGRVTVQSMLAGLCIYLLIAIGFALLYGSVEQIGNEPFFVTLREASTADFLYFSFTTMTTTGYGDLTAATGLGRGLAITEMLIGQIYLVTVVALIVGNLGRRRFA